MSKEQIVKFFTNTRQCLGCKHLCLERAQRDEFPCMNSERTEDKRTHRCLSKVTHSLAS